MHSSLSGYSNVVAVNHEGFFTLSTPLCKSELNHVHVLLQNVARGTVSPCISHLPACCCCFCCSSLQHLLCKTWSCFGRAMEIEPAGFSRFFAHTYLFVCQDCWVGDGGPPAAQGDQHQVGQKLQRYITYFLIGSINNLGPDMLVKKIVKLLPVGNEIQIGVDS